MLTALGFMIFNLISYFLSLTRGPFWGLFAYINIYFNAPVGHINWWANSLPFHRWSLLTSIVLLVSLILHKDTLSKHKFANIRWVFVFIALSLVITYTGAIDYDNSRAFLFRLFSYCFIIYVILRSLKVESQFRLFLLGIISLTGYLCLNIFFHGERVNNRLEGSGPGDAYGSNELALLLVAILPILIVFLKNGRTFERMIALCSFPFILNAFILCNSRGASVALAGGLFIAGIIVADNQIRKGLVILMLVMAPAFLYLTDAAYIERFSTLLGLSEAIETEDSSAELSSGRTVIWGYGMEMAKDNPMGVGPNGFKRLARFYMPEEILTFTTNKLGQRAAHNTYLQAMVEQGFFGLFIWFCLLLHTCLILIKSFKLVSNLRSPQPFLRNCVFAMNVAFFSIVLGGVFTSRIYYEFFWWQIAMAAVVYALVKQLVEKEAEETEETEEQVQV